MGTEDVQQIQQAPAGVSPGQEGSSAPGHSADVQAYLAALAGDAGTGDLTNDGYSANVAPPIPADIPDWAPALPALPEVDPWTDPVLSEAEQWAAAEAPAPRPEAYEIPSVHHDRVEEVGAESLAEARGLRSLLYAANLPATDGSALLHQIAEAARREPAPPDDVSFELQMQRTHKTLRQMMGDAEFDRCQAALGALHAGMVAKNPALADYLGDAAHLIATPIVLHRLLVHAGRGLKR